ncbi:hypothetical protein T4D_9611 [Trichinella pseudospiralis]|uniref:Uncharacterized protein n=1 Tax=Trichinella pseudospiralis TaxID=6337 RepID=A0A0V1FZG3_TRIPS|nr:hypothetical protein T4D_9611 [Trichinella pseudospiralis]
MKTTYQSRLLDLDINQPGLIRSYNNGTGGVDLLDQLSPAYQPSIRGKNEPCESSSCIWNFEEKWSCAFTRWQARTKNTSRTACRRGLRLVVTTTRHTLRWDLTIHWALLLEADASVPVKHSEHLSEMQRSFAC